MTTLHELKALVLSDHPLVAIETLEEERVQNLLAAAAADLRMPLYHWSITEGLARYSARTPIDPTRAPADLLRYLHQSPTDGIYHLKDFSRHLTDPSLCRSAREIASQFSRSRSMIVLTGEPIELPPEIEQLTVRLQMQLPTQAELRGLVQTVVRSLAPRLRFEIRLTPGDLDAMVRALSGLTLDQARQAVSYAIVEDRRLDHNDVAGILKRKGRLIESAGILEYFPEDGDGVELGGFERLKRWLERARMGFTPEAAGLNLPAPRGLMIVGVPGCGKSLAAKFIARRWNLPLLKLDAGRLYDKFVGETERNFRRAVSLAESMAPTIFWIDEIEKMFASSGPAESDAGLSQRVFASFLTWLQEKKKEVFVVGVANDLFRLPPEFLRKGRFDEVFFVDLPESAERVEIFRIHLLLRKQQPESFHLEELADAAVGFSGAEIEQVIIASLYRALFQKRPLDMSLLREEISGTEPLSRARSEDIERIRDSARGRFVNVR